MNILALDTTSAWGSVAIVSNGHLRAEKRLESADGFGHVIFQAIEAALAQSGMALAQMDCFAGASGPGSFTGVRVGLAAVKGLAEAMGTPAIGVSNLRAMAVAGSAAERAVILDARRNEVYAAVYSAGLELLSPEVVTELPEWLAALRPFAGEFIRAEELSPWPSGDVPFVRAERYLAKAIAYCAEMDGLRGLWQDPAAVEANYVRRSDAELFSRAQR